MMKVFLLLALFLFITVNAQGPLIPVIDGWTLTNINISDASKQADISSYVTGSTNFTFFHCFGEYDWYFGGGYLPNTTSYDLRGLWPGGNSLMDGFEVNNIGTAYFLLVCKNDYSNNCASVDFLVVNQSATTLEAVFPEPPKRGLSGTLSKDRKSGTVTWHTTNNDADTYEVFWETNSQGKGDYYSTACAVRYWMTPLNTTQGNVTDNHDGTQTLSLNNLPEGPFTVAVVINRIGGYSNVYDLFTLNAGYALVPSMYILFLSVAGIIAAVL